VPVHRPATRNVRLTTEWHPRASIPCWNRLDTHRRVRLHLCAHCMNKKITVLKAAIVQSILGQWRGYKIPKYFSMCVITPKHKTKRVVKNHEKRMKKKHRKMKNTRAKKHWNNCRDVRKLLKVVALQLVLIPAGYPSCCTYQLWVEMLLCLRCVLGVRNSTLRTPKP
jgi:hypothetical protein